MNKYKKTFINYIYSKAREYEALDINHKRKSFIERNSRYLFAFPFSVFIICTLQEGYSSEFLQLGASILAILIGLFITALVFALDKFYNPSVNNKKDYKLVLSENERTRNLEMSIDEVKFLNAKEKLWNKQSLYYVQKFNVIVGKSVIVGVWALALICLNVMYIDFFSVDLSNYAFVSLTFQSFLIFLKFLLVVLIRFLICYYVIEVFCNTIKIISSMVNFMSVKIKRE